MTKNCNRLKNEKIKNKNTNEKMIKTHSYEDRQSLLETGGGRIQKTKIIIITIIIKTERETDGEGGGRRWGLMVGQSG